MVLYWVRLCLLSNSSWLSCSFLFEIEKNAFISLDVTALVCKNKGSIYVLSKLNYMYIFKNWTTNHAFNAIVQGNLQSI